MSTHAHVQLHENFSARNTPGTTKTLAAYSPLRFQQTFGVSGCAYLCAGDHGGTAFYRHRTTGYEYVDHQRAAEYKCAVDKDVRQQGMPAASYMDGSTEIFEKIASFNAMFNRILIYRCTSLHSGNIAADFSFDPNPRTGRLSLNTFIFCRD